MRRASGDLAALAWWPDTSRTADLSLRLLSYTAAGELPVESINPDAFDLGEIDFGALDLRRFRPEDYFT